MFHNMICFLLLTGLIGASYYDLRYKEIPTIYLFGLWGFLFVMRIVENKGISKEILLGEVLGIILILISLVLKQSIGMGDGIVLCITGLIEGGLGNLTLFMNSLLIGVVVAVVLIFFKSYKRNNTIPFVPCILIAYIGRVIF